ncbi:MFS transporter [Marinomonas sp. MED121]|uniref:MFS transporter n=1 Tax=Marinomonas sp. MED121 TaxID=314277 RepID=UPI000309B5B7|nr:MFS transporter [Marinomonas sp. MED121]
MNIYLYLNRFMTALADYGLMFLIPLFVFQTTQSAQLAGLAFTIEYLVKVFFSPVASLLIDRYPLIKLMSLVNIIRALVSILVATGLFLLDGQNNQIIFALVVLLSVFNGLGFAINFMAQETLLTQLIEAKYFAKVQAQVQSLEQTALVTAPILFAAALSVAEFHWVLTSLVLIFIIANISLLKGTKQTLVDEPSDRLLSLKHRLAANFSIGKSYLFHSKPLQRIVLSTFLLNLIYGTLLAIGAPAVIGYFEKDAASFASLQTAGALASILVLVMIVKLSDRATPTQLGIIAFICVSLGGFISGFANSFELFVIGAMLVLGFDGMFNVYIRTRRMEIIARKDYSKVMGLLMIVNNVSKPLSGFIVFSLGHWFSVLEILIFATAFASILTFALKLFQTSKDENTFLESTE